MAVSPADRNAGAICQPQDYFTVLPIDRLDCTCRNPMRAMNPRTVKYYSDLLRHKFGVATRRQLIPLRVEEDEQ